MGIRECVLHMLRGGPDIVNTSQPIVYTCQRGFKQYPSHEVVGGVSFWFMNLLKLI